MLWNKWGMIQQAITFVVLFFVYTIIVLTLHRSPKPLIGLHQWRESLLNLFVTPKWYWEILLGLVLGTAISHVLLTLDILVAWIFRKNIPQWIHRADHLLPVGKSQRTWALSISIVGSILEEIIFRAFIFLAILPLWSHWIWAVLILSTIFALFHAGVQGFWSTLWIFLSSIILCQSIAAGFSIYFVSAVHIMMNINNLFLIPLLYYRKQKSQE